jgi:bifunctional non-homologous end joining protein LigD
MASRRPKPVTIDCSNVAGAVEAPATQWIEPQLATLAAAAPEGHGWAHEIKLDGYRMQAHIRAGATILTSRNGIDWSAKFPELCGLLAELPVTEAIVDGEVCHLSPWPDSAHSSHHQAFGGAP